MEESSAKMSELVCVAGTTTGQPTSFNLTTAHMSNTRKNMSNILTQLLNPFKKGLKNRVCWKCLQVSATSSVGHTLSVQ